MASSASSSSAPLALAPAVEPPTLDRLLADLRHRSWEDPVDAGRAVLQAASSALEAEALAVWLFDESGAAAAMLHHPPRAVGCGAHDPAQSAEPAPDREALRAEGVASVERSLGTTRCSTPASGC